MRIIRVLSMVMFGLIGVSNANAIPIDFDGEKDLILGVISKQDFDRDFGPGNSEENEQAWAQSIIGSNPVLDFDADGVRDEDVIMEFGGMSGLLGAFALTDSPEHFIVKNAQGFVLMQNIADLNYGVLDTGDPILDSIMINLKAPGPTTISHVTQFGSSSNSVPEPTSLALALAGIVGFGFTCRRKSV